MSNNQPIENIQQWNNEQVCTWIAQVLTGKDEHKVNTTVELVKALELDGDALLATESEEAFERKLNKAHISIYNRALDIRFDSIITVLWASIQRLKVPKSSGLQNQNLYPVERFEQLLREGRINRPDESTLLKIRKHFSSRMMVVKSADEAVDLYEDAEQLPGTTTRAVIMENSNLKLNGPLDVDHYGVKIVVGVDPDGKPIIVKILYGASSHVTPEVEAISNLGLNTLTNIPLVSGELQTISIKDSDSRTMRYSSGIYHCFIMPYYPTSLARLPAIPQEAAYKGALRILEALAYVHKCNYVHMDVKPANIFLNMAGEWFLGDFGSCVHVNGVIRETTRVMLPKNYEPEASPQIDKYMLGVTLVLAITPHTEHSDLLKDHGVMEQYIRRIQNVHLNELLLQLFSALK